MYCLTFNHVLSTDCLFIHCDTVVMLLTLTISQICNWESCRIFHTQNKR